MTEKLYVSRYRTKEHNYWIGEVETRSGRRFAVISTIYRETLTEYARTQKLELVDEQAKEAA